jgi:hypothetical protein
MHCTYFFCRRTTRSETLSITSWYKRILPPFGKRCNLRYRGEDSNQAKLRVVPLLSLSPTVCQTHYAQRSTLSLSSHGSRRSCSGHLTRLCSEFFYLTQQLACTFTRSKITSFVGQISVYRVACFTGRRACNRIKPFLRS